MRRPTFGMALKITPLAALVAFTLAGCNPNPVVVQRKPAVTDTTPAKDETPPAVGTTTKNDDGTFTLEFPLPGSAAGSGSRSLINYENAGELQAAADYYQMVLVDDTDAASLSEIWASASAARDPDPAKNGVLRVVVKGNTTYHILFLHGKKASASADPVLLGSGYLKYHVGTTSDSVTIRMVPVLIDAAVTQSAVKWASVKNIAWVKAGAFDVTVSLFSRDATQDGKSKPHGNALWPLRLAAARSNPAVWAQFMADMPFTGADAAAIAAAKASPQYNAGNRTGNYWEYDGEANVLTSATLSNMDAPVKMASAKFSAKAAGYYSEGLDPSAEAAPDTKAAPSGVDAAAKTITGTFTFSAFNSLATASQTSDYAKVSFNDAPNGDLTYIPFGDADWTQAKAGGQVAPQWKIVVDPLYLAYRLYAKPAGKPAAAVQPVGIPAVIPTGISWATASKDLQALTNLASIAYAQDSSALKEIWAQAGTYTQNAADGTASTGTVVNISVVTNGVALYGGFLPRVDDADDKDNRLAALNSSPATRSTWFHTYAKLAIGNEYGTVSDTRRETFIDAVNDGTAVIVDGARNLVLDGFTITRGALSGLSIKNAPATTLFTNLKASDNKNPLNSGDTGGAGIRVAGGAPRLSNFTTTGNSTAPSTDRGGAGLFITNNSAATVTNAMATNNTASDQGGGISIAGSSTPRLENIIVTHNVATILGGGGIYINASPVIVNAIVSGNSAEAQTTGGDGGGGGGILVWGGNPVIVNVLVSGNRVIHTGANNMTGGGGIKIVKVSPRFINVTVSGNYSNTRGGGIFLPSSAIGSDGTTGCFYNTVALGNYSESADYADDDVWVGLAVPGAYLDNGANLLSFNAGGWRSFVFNNSLMGGRLVNGSGVHTDWDASSPVTPGANNASGVNLGGYKTTGDVDTLATSRLDGKFFVKFAGRPTAGNTGLAYNPALWDFHLDGGALGAVNGGDASHYTLVTGGVTTDLDGAPRIRSTAPDMGAYESNIASVPVTGIALNKSRITLFPPGDSRGDNTTLVATITPSNATNQALSWSSSNPTGVSVTNATVGADGKVTVTVTALITGATATITVSSTDGSGVTATCAVTVLSTVSGGAGFGP